MLPRLRPAPARLGRAGCQSSPTENAEHNEAHLAFISWVLMREARRSGNTVSETTEAGLGSAGQA